MWLSLRGLSLSVFELYVIVIKRIEVWSGRQESDSKSGRPTIDEKDADPQREGQEYFNQN